MNTQPIGTTLKILIANFYSACVSLIKKWLLHALLYVATSSICIILLSEFFKELIIISIHKNDMQTTQTILFCMVLFTLFLITIIINYILKIPYPFYSKFYKIEEFRTAMNSIGIIDLKDQINEAKRYGLNLFISKYNLQTHKYKFVYGKPYLEFNTRFHSFEKTEQLALKERLFFIENEFNLQISSINDAVNQRSGEKINKLIEQIHTYEIQIKGLQTSCNIFQEENVKLRKQLNAAKASAGNEQKAVVKKKIIDQLVSIALNIMKQEQIDKLYTHTTLNKFINERFIISESYQKCFDDCPLDFDEIHIQLQNELWKALPAHMRKGAGRPSKKML
mgnify:CR=1 FL=1